MHKGRLYVFTGPSGAGKGTVLHRLLDEVPGLSLSVSATTRVPRPGEQDGVHYYFISKQAFEQKIAENAFLEYAEYVDNYYGTPEHPVEEQLAAGRDVILEIEVQGAMQVHRKRPDAVMVFLAPPSLEELDARLHGRGTESEEKIRQRLETARRELEYQRNFAHIVVNDTVDHAVALLKALILHNRTENNPEAACSR